MTQRAPACPRNHATFFFVGGSSLIAAGSRSSFLVLRHAHAAAPDIQAADDLEALALCLFAAAPHHNTRVTLGLAGPMFCPAAGGGGPGACDGRRVSIRLIANLSVFSSLGERR